MGRLSREWEHEHGEEAVSRETASSPLTQEAPVRSLAWASAIGNQAVQRLARRTLAREAAEEEEEEELDEGPAVAEAVEDAPPADESSAGPEIVEEAAPPAEQAPPGDVAPEEAEGLAALDELPEDELPQ